MARSVIKANVVRPRCLTSSYVLDGAAFQMPEVRDVLLRLVRIYMPSYTPHEVQVSPGIERLAEKYSAMTVKRSQLEFCHRTRRLLF
ncbi:hypothetical protein MK280_15200 [Myxococcota bacterium]|nr:hypothetical protein [Myxococcota bacterium]